MLAVVTPFQIRLAGALLLVAFMLWFVGTMSLTAVRQAATRGEVPLDEVQQAETISRWCKRGALALVGIVASVVVVGLVT
jgi:flagellar biosynthesis protein FlhB